MTRREAALAVLSEAWLTLTGLRVMQATSGGGNSSNPRRAAGPVGQARSRAVGARSAAESAARRQARSGGPRQRRHRPAQQR